MITLTIIAAEKLKELIAQENIAEEIPTTAGLRFGIENNPQRIFLKLESAPKEKDALVNSRGIRFFIDPESQQYIKNTPTKSILICWIGGEQSSGFTIENQSLKSSYIELEIKKKTITIAEKAAVHLRRKIEASKFKDSPEVGIRFGVRAGGCSGFIYLPLDVEARPDKYDQVFESNGIRIFVFKKILPIVQGTEIDHSSINLLENFIFNNPNAKISCGCGVSFDLK